MRKKKLEQKKLDLRSSYLLSLENVLEPGQVSKLMVFEKKFKRTLKDQLKKYPNIRENKQKRYPEKYPERERVQPEKKEESKAATKAGLLTSLILTKT